MLKLIKIKSKQTYKNKEGKECHYYNFALVLENGKRVQIKPSFARDYLILNCICEVANNGK